MGPERSNLTLHEFTSLTDIFAATFFKAVFEEVVFAFVTPGIFVVLTLDGVLLGLEGAVDLCLPAEPATCQPSPSKCVPTSSDTSAGIDTCSSTCGGPCVCSPPTAPSCRGGARSSTGEGAFSSEGREETYILSLTTGPCEDEGSGLLTSCLEEEDRFCFEGGWLSSSEDDEPSFLERFALRSIG